ncbi:MAG TPA: hypothetical protein VNS32_03360 [Flavisolibacter sp.]|nr:hypothetical protein [Flavisolibacter sp.]
MKKYLKASDNEELIRNMLNDNLALTNALNETLAMKHNLDSFEESQYFIEQVLHIAAIKREEITNRIWET